MVGQIKGGVLLAIGSCQNLLCTDGNTWNMPGVIYASCDVVL